jgi:hypothetical protein
LCDIDRRKTLWTLVERLDTLDVQLVRQDQDHCIKFIDMASKQMIEVIELFLKRRDLSKAEYNDASVRAPLGDREIPEVAIVCDKDSLLRESNIQDVTIVLSTNIVSND